MRRSKLERLGSLLGVNRRVLQATIDRTYGLRRLIMNDFLLLRIDLVRLIRLIARLTRRSPRQSHLQIALRGLDIRLLLAHARSLLLNDTPLAFLQCIIN